MNYYEINSPYYALLKAHTPEKALEKYVEVVADDDGSLKEEIREVDRAYALVKYARGVGEDKSQRPVHELLDEFYSGKSDVLLVDVMLV